MAGEGAAPATMDFVSAGDEAEQPADTGVESAVVESKPVGGAVIANSSVIAVSQIQSVSEDTAATQNDGADTQANATAVIDNADGTTGADPLATTDIPVKRGGPGKRKSTFSISEYKKNTPTKGKKKITILHLNVSPGDMFMVAMRGYQPWPVIVCDEQMLPESLISKRPVSAKRIDGTYRDDYLEGGKNAKDRRYPIMFLGTNEFAWQVNTELLPFDLDEVKEDVKSGNQGKKSKALWEAYHIAADGNNLSHFKQMLAQHEKAMQDDLEKREQKEQKKKNKAEKAAKRKSTAIDESDVDMEDAQEDDTLSGRKLKQSKKRKKGDESEGENEKPAKTPKTKLKLTTKTPKDASTKGKKDNKGKKHTDKVESLVPEEPQLTESERRQKREKQVLYLRHRLQKGFLSRSEAPKDEDMLNMSDYLKQLEIQDDLEADIIKKTKVHKVLRAIVKLDFIPKEEEYHFKQRSNDLLARWNGFLAIDIERASTMAQPSTNGVKNAEIDKIEPANGQPATSKSEDADKKTDTPTEEVIVRVKNKDKDSNAAMVPADEEANKDVLAGIGEIASGADGSPGAAMSTEPVKASS